MVILKPFFLSWFDIESIFGTNSFEKTLENFNIVPINPTGQEFDPEKHEAVSTVNNPGEKDNFVTNTLERGWTLNERVVKPALVVVNKK